MKVFDRRGPQMAPVTIHVIDDDEAMRRSLAFLLESAGFSVSTHDSAVAFLALPEISETAVVVTDVRMPDVSGLELVQRMRARGMAHAVIMVTGHGDGALGAEALKAGALEVLEKPFGDEALLSAIRVAIQDGPPA